MPVTISSPDLKKWLFAGYYLASILKGLWSDLYVQIIEFIAKMNQGNADTLTCSRNDFETAVMEIKNKKE